MFKINQKGVADPIVIVLLVAILALAVFIFIRVSNNEENNNTDTSTSTEVESQPAGSLVSGVSFSVPEGFQSMTCDETGETALLSPESDVAQDCDDRTNVILISSGSTENGSGTECYPDSAIAEIRKTKPLYKYECENIKVGEYDVAKTQSQALEQIDPELGGGPNIGYDFLGAPKMLNISYFSTADGELPYSAEAEELVQSAVFY